MGGRRIYHARGKVLGGSSSINGMIFQRGNPLDLERWAGDPGMQSWNYASCLPYYKRMETCLAGADEYRGGDGPLLLERGPATNPLFGAFFEAVQQAGYSLTDDVNGYRQEGFAKFDRNIRRGRRLSAARAYLHPVMRRKNLTVETRAHVTRVLFEGTRAVGVRYRTGAGLTRDVRGAEVILCGGSINSPQVLELSGVGDAARLRGARHRRRARPARRRREPAGSPRGVHPVRLEAARLGRARDALPQRAARLPRVAAAAPRARARRTTSRAAASPARTTTSPTRT